MSSPLHEFLSKHLSDQLAARVLSRLDFFLEVRTREYQLPNGPDGTLYGQLKTLAANGDGTDRQIQLVSFNRVAAELPGSQDGTVRGSLLMAGASSPLAGVLSSKAALWYPEPIAQHSPAQIGGLRFAMFQTLLNGNAPTTGRVYWNDALRILEAYLDVAMAIERGVINLGALLANIEAVLGVLPNCVPLGWRVEAPPHQNQRELVVLFA